MTANDDDFLSCFEGFENERVTLTDAVQYIAAANLRLGKTDRLNPWKAANEIVRAIQCGELTAYGQSDGRAVTRVPVSVFSHADPYPSQDDYLIANGSQRSLRWRDGRSPYGEGDAIMEGRHTVWRRIVVDRREVVRLWPFDTRGASGAKNVSSMPIDAEVTGDDAPIRRKLSEAGKRSGEVRRQNRPWVPHAEALVKAIIAEFPEYRRGRIATEVSSRWKEELDLLPSHETLVNFVKELERAGDIQRTKRGNEQVQPGARTGSTA